jgi:hypothetical protein
MMALLRAPDLLDLVSRQKAGEKIEQAEILQALASHPEIAQPVLEAMLASGEIVPFASQKKEPYRNPIQRSTSGKKKRKK